MSLRTTVSTALVAAAIAAPGAEARIDPPQDLRGPDARPVPEFLQDVRSADAPDAARSPVTPPARAADQSGDDFPWLAAALFAGVVSVGAGARAARRRFRVATGG
jgi:hypothetical protein